MLCQFQHRTNLENFPRIFWQQQNLQWFQRCNPSLLSRCFKQFYIFYQRHGPTHRGTTMSWVSTLPKTSLIITSNLLWSLPGLSAKDNLVTWVLWTGYTFSFTLSLALSLSHGLHEACLMFHFLSHEASPRSLISDSSMPHVPLSLTWLCLIPFSILRR